MKFLKGDDRVKMDRQLFQKLLIVVAFGVLLNFAVQHLDVLGQGLSWVGAVVEPFVLGGVGRLHSECTDACGRTVSVSRKENISD